MQPDTYSIDVSGKKNSCEEFLLCPPFCACTENASQMPLYLRTLWSLLSDILVWEVRKSPTLSHLDFERNDSVNYVHHFFLFSFQSLAQPVDFSLEDEGISCTNFTEN